VFAPKLAITISKPRSIRLGFLAHKDKVVVSVVFRGRELAHIEEGHRVLKRVLELLTEDGKPESPPSQQGKRIICTIVPK
jgi:translation initiation factor IF-3